MRALKKARRVVGEDGEIKDEGGDRDGKVLYVVWKAAERRDM